MVERSVKMDNKDLRILKKYNENPMEIEEIIYKHTEILECVVVGKEDTYNSEEIIAVCVKNSPA